MCFIQSRDWGVDMDQSSLGTVAGENRVFSSASCGSSGQQESCTPTHRQPLAFHIQGIPHPGLLCLGPTCHGLTYAAPNCLSTKKLASPELGAKRLPPSKHHSTVQRQRAGSLLTSTRSPWHLSLARLRHWWGVWAPMAHGSAQVTPCPESPLCKGKGGL